jgi:hypothetical protein
MAGVLHGSLIPEAAARHNEISGGMFENGVDIN